MIKWVTVLIHIPTGEIRTVKECGSPPEDEPNPDFWNLNLENDPQYYQKNFCVDAETNVNATWLRENLEDVPNSMPRLKPDIPAQELAKVGRIIDETTGKLDYTDRRLAYQQLMIEGNPPQSDQEILDKVAAIRAAR